VLHVIIVIYLFLGIAIICDEQFTSSLESICNPRTGLGLSPDVAGATFMAAGSSAPELASSFMGTFVSKSDVGLGTIIGSAVFNILIIIGATAIVVGEPMQLDWKPLGRDVFFYCGAVILLIAFVAADNLIAWYEALILLLYYGGYITWMFFNTGLMRKIAKAFGDNEEDVHARSRRPSFSSGMWHHETPSSKYEAPVEEKEKEKEKAGLEVGVPTEAGSEAGSAPAAPTGSGRGLEIPGDESDMQIVDLSAPQFGLGAGNGEMEIPGTPTMGTVVSPSVEIKKTADVVEEGADVEKGAEEETKDEEKKEDGDEEEEEASVPEMICNILSMPYILLYGITMPDCKYEDPTDDDADAEIAAMQKEQGVDDARKSEITAKIASLEKQKDLRAQIQDAEDAEDDDKVAELSKTLFAMYEPLDSNQKLYLVTFFVSLMWITILSYFMVTLMEKIGCAWGISSFIMGITFLAMGTSVPDALGSIAVAKEGEGDMAVSNAIGSNVFDICIGLGIPWFLVTLIDGDGKKIIAATESILASATILFLVVVVLFMSLYCSKHPETGKPFCLYPVVGYILFSCYACFVIFQITWTAAGLPE